MRRTQTVRYLLALIGVLAVSAALVYYFGVPQAPKTASVRPSGGAPATVGADPVSPVAPSPLGAAGAPASLGDSERPSIQIPGCTCHSKDPIVRQQHAAYTLSQCAECH